MSPRFPVVASQALPRSATHQDRKAGQEQRWGGLKRDWRTGRRDVWRCPLNPEHLLPSSILHRLNWLGQQGCSVRTKAFCHGQVPLQKMEKHQSQFFNYTNHPTVVSAMQGIHSRPAPSPSRLPLAGRPRGRAARPPVPLWQRCPPRASRCRLGPPQPAGPDPCASLMRFPCCRRSSRWAPPPSSAQSRTASTCPAWPPSQRRCGT